MDQVNDLIRQWRDFYMVQPLRGRKNQTAKELFDPGRGAGVDPKALCFLMMKAEVKGVRRNRLTFDGFDWVGDCLYGLKQNVIVRYSLSDRSRVYVFNLQNQFVGVVEPAEFTAPRDHAAAQRITSERRRLLRQTNSLSKMARTASPEVIDLISRKNPDLIEYIQAEEMKNEPPKLTAFLHDDRAPEAACMAVDPVASTSETEASGPAERPIFYSDTEKFEWLMKQPFISPKDQAWLDDLAERIPVFKQAMMERGNQ